MINLSPNFIIGHIRIGSIESASCLNMGNNFPTNFKSKQKHNQGFGSVGGDNNDLSDIGALLGDFSGNDFFDDENKQKTMRVTKQNSLLKGRER